MTKLKLDALNARRKGDRLKIARAIEEAAAPFGATVEVHDYGSASREIVLNVSLNYVGAMVIVDDCLGGSRSLIHWHNARGPSYAEPVRNFSPIFNVVTGSADSRSYGRGHHKATSYDETWSGLITTLGEGLALAQSGEAFEPQQEAA